VESFSVISRPIEIINHGAEEINQLALQSFPASNELYRRLHSPVAYILYLYKEAAREQKSAPSQKHVFSTLTKAETFFSSSRTKIEDALGRFRFL